MQIRQLFSTFLKLVILTMLFGLQGCHRNSSNNNKDDDTSDFITLDSHEISIAATGNASIVVTNRGGVNALNVSVFGLPSTIGATSCPSIVPNGSCTITLTATNALLQTYAVSVRGSNTNAPSARITVSLNWQSINGPAGSIVQSIVTVTPILKDKKFVPEVVIIGTLHGGVWESSDGGNSWTQIGGVPGDGLTNLDVNSLTFISNGTLYAGTADGVFALAPSQTVWTKVGGLTNDGLTNTYVNELLAQGNNLYAGTQGGVFVLLANANSWSRAGGNGVNSLDAQTLSLDTDGILYLGTSGQGIYSKNSSSVNSPWVQIGDTDTGLTNLYVTQIVPTTSGIIYASTQGGVFKRAASSTDWVQIGGAGTTPSGGGNVFITPPDGLLNPNVTSMVVDLNGNVFVGTQGNGVYELPFGTTDWILVGTTAANTVVNTLYLDTATNDIYAGANGRGVFELFNATTDFEQIGGIQGDGLINEFINTLDIRSGRLLAGGFGGAYTSTLNSNTWTQIGGLFADALTTTEITSYVYDSSNNLYVGTYGGGVFELPNASSTWTAVSTIGLDSSIILSIAIGADNHLYVGTFGDGIFDVALPVSSTSVWAQTGTDTVSAPVSESVAQSLIFNNTNNLIVGTYTGVFKLVSGTWQKIGGSSGDGLTAQDVEVLFFDPSANLYAGTNDGIFKLASGGTVWTQIGGRSGDGLTNEFVHAITQDSALSLYAGTNTGVYKLINGQTVWNQIGGNPNDGLVNSIVYSLAVSTNQLYAGTYGGSVYLGTTS